MIAVDTNILVYAHRRDSEWFTPAASCLKDLAEGQAAWALPWPCIHEFIAITTHDKIFNPPSSIKHAIEQVEAWMASPTLLLLAESGSHWGTLVPLLTSARIRGPMVHDARIAALCLQHGVRELWTADRDFSRFRDITVRNPLITA